MMRTGKRLTPEGLHITLHGLQHPGALHELAEFSISASAAS